VGGNQWKELNNLFVGCENRMEEMGQKRKRETSEKAMLVDYGGKMDEFD
jgi:hypothetical protein